MPDFRPLLKETSEIHGRIQVRTPPPEVDRRKPLLVSCNQLSIDLRLVKQSMETILCTNRSYQRPTIARQVIGKILGVAGANNLRGGIVAKRVAGKAIDAICNLSDRGGTLIIRRFNFPTRH